MSEPPSPPDAHTGDASRLSLTRLLTAAGFLGLIAVIGGLLWKLNNAAPAVQTENAGLKQQLANMQEMLTDLKRAEQLRTEEEQVKRSDLQVTAAAADEAARAVTAFEKASTDWERTTRELLAGEKGKPIAANAEALAQFQALWKQPRPEVEDPSTLRRRLEPLKAVIDKALASKDSSYAPGEEIVTRLKSVRDDAGRGARAYEELNHRLDALVSSAPAGAMGGSTPSLEAAVKELERRQTAEENAVIAAAIEKERHAGAERIAKEKAESERKSADAQVSLERARGEAEAKRLADEETAARAKAAEEAGARALAMKEAEQERRFSAVLPEVRSLLMPFISEGFKQPHEGAFSKTTLKKLKVSYGGLQGSGFLEEIPDAVYKLVTSSLSNRQNDRPLGSFPSEWSNNYQDPWFARGKRAQELLREFGPLMVKKGMLEP